MPKKVRHVEYDGIYYVSKLLPKVRWSRKAVNVRKKGQLRSKLFCNEKKRSSDDYGRFVAPFQGPVFQVVDGNLILLAGMFFLRFWHGFWEGSGTEAEPV